MKGAPKAGQHPWTGAAMSFLEYDLPRGQFRAVELSPRQIELLVEPLQRLLEEAYAAGREDAHKELVCELEGGDISSRCYPR